MRALTGANDALAFVLEVVALAALALAAFTLDAPLALRVLLGVGGPLLVAVVWGRWLAPKAPRRIDPPASLVAKALLFGLTAAVTVLAGYVALGWALAATAGVNLAVTAVLGRSAAVR